MRKTVCLAAIAVVLGAASTQAELFIGWDGGSGAGAQAINATGISGAMWTANTYAIDATAGSTDGTFGPTITGAATTPTAYAVRTAVPGTQDTLTFTITNGTGGQIQLDSVVFDYSRWFANGPQTLTLTYLDGNGGAGLVGVADDTVVQTFTSSPIAGKASNYTDYEASLSGLVGQTMFATGTARFSLVASGALGTTSNGAFDNIGIVGSVIPEPATLGLVALVGAGLLTVRRFMMV